MHGRIVGDAATRSLRSGYGPPLLDFRILGPLEVVSDTAALRLGGPKRRAVLAILLLDTNRVVSIDKLANELYGDERPATAVTQLHAQISQLRKILDPGRPAGSPGSLLETREPGYVIRLEPEQVDLHRFERLAHDALGALRRGDHEAASDGFRRALGLWRGPALADLVDEPFAGPAAARLEELRLAALDRRVEADLALGRHHELVGELEALVAGHPYREGLRGQLMLALYRSGRQADALAVYRDARRLLVESFGVEPTPALQELERGILRQDRALDLASGSAGTRAEEGRTILAVERHGIETDVPAKLVAALATSAGTALVAVRLVAEEGALPAATAAAAEHWSSLAVGARAAAFVSHDVADDVVRLVRENLVRLVLLGATAEEVAGPRLPEELAAVLDRSPADAGVAVGDHVQLGSGGVVHVPFGGGEHDWAALELAAWLASAAGMRLRLLGTASDSAARRRDASRLLANASLAVQRVVGVESEPVLVAPEDRALADAVRPAQIVVVGITPRWRGEGIGRTRRIVVVAGPPVVLVHRGVRPGGLAPRETSTRFTWSIER